MFLKKDIFCNCKIYLSMPFKRHLSQTLLRVRNDSAVVPLRKIGSPPSNHRYHLPVVYLYITSRRSRFSTIDCQPLSKPTGFPTGETAAAGLNSPRPGRGNKWPRTPFPNSTQLLNSNSSTAHKIPPSLNAQNQIRLWSRNLNTFASKG